MGDQFCHIYVTSLSFNTENPMTDQENFMPKHTILVVDDEQSIRDMLAISLDAAGYNVLQAEGAREAHALIIDRHPDLVLLDWMMPGTTGLELLRRLKRDEMTEKLPVIMLTAKPRKPARYLALIPAPMTTLPNHFPHGNWCLELKRFCAEGREELKDPIVVGELLFDPSVTESAQRKLINVGPTNTACCNSF